MRLIRPCGRQKKQNLDIPVATRVPEPRDHLCRGQSVMGVIESGSNAVISKTHPFPQARPSRRWSAGRAVQQPLCESERVVCPSVHSFPSLSLSTRSPLMAPRSVPASAAVTATASSSPSTAGRGDPRCPACCHACRQQAAASTSARPSPTAALGAGGGGSVQLAPAPFLLDQHKQQAGLHPDDQAGGGVPPPPLAQVDGLVAATGAMAIDPRINLNAHQQDSTTPQAPAPAAAVAPTPTRKSRHHRHGHGHHHHHHHHHRHHGGSKPKRPPPAPPADGSQAAPVPPKPVLPPDGSVKTCEAVDRYDELCDEVVVGGWKGKVPRRWCQIHEDEEKHVRSSFWSTLQPNCQPRKLFELTISDFVSLQTPCHRFRDFLGHIRYQHQPRSPRRLRSPSSRHGRRSRGNTSNWPSGHTTRGCFTASTFSRPGAISSIGWKAGGRDRTGQIWHEARGRKCA